jgi:hypothetical protein
MKDQRVDGGLLPERFAAVAREQRVEPSRDRAMRISRSRSVTGKVTEEEYARLEARASPQRISTWARDVLLQALEPAAGERALLAELLALRTILVNVIFALANGQAITTEAMRAIIDHADQGKTGRATERLATLTARDMT